MIHPLSLKSLFIQPYFNTERLSSATGFIVEKNKQFYLVTNRHVVTGKNTETNNCMRADAAVPNKLKIFLPDLVDKSIEWKTVDIFLYSGGTITDESKLWLEHSDGNRVDVVLVPLSDYKIQNKFQVCNFDLDLANADLVVEPAMPVSIIGFPLGYCGGGMLPIWVTGFIASEPEVDID